MIKVIMKWSWGLCTDLLAFPYSWGKPQKTSASRPSDKEVVRPVIASNEVDRNAQHVRKGRRKCWLRPELQHQEISRPGGSATTWRDITSWALNKLIFCVYRFMSFYTSFFCFISWSWVLNPSHELSVCVCVHCCRVQIEIKAILILSDTLTSLFNLF